MTDKRVLVIEHQGNAGLNFLGGRIEAAGLDIDTVGPDAGAPLPSSLEGYSGLIVLGGAMGPTDDDDAPWLPQTRKLMADAVDTKLPLFGICLGSQLLATATGGRVDKIDGPPEIGVCEVTFDQAQVEGDHLFGHLAGSTVPAMQWHYLEVVDLPAEAQLLASSDACRTQAFRVGERAWGVQFHPEALGDTAVDWVDEDPEGPGNAGLTSGAVIAKARENEAALRELWGGVAERFAGVVKG